MTSKKVTVCARRLSGGLRPTGFASHVAVLVGDTLYEFDKEGVKSSRSNGVPPMWYSKVAGNTTKTDAEIKKFNEEYPKLYKLFGASCQSYAIKLVDFLGLNGGVVNDMLEEIPGDFD